MPAQNYTAPVATVKPAEDILIDLPPLADGTPVQGTIDAGLVIGTTATWRGIAVGIGFTAARNKPYVDIDFDDPVWVTEKQFPGATWSQRRKRFDQKMPRRMAELIEHNIIEQIIERARNWTPQLFR